MLSKIFGVISLLSVIIAVFTGRIQQVGLSVAEGADSAVRLIISLAGMMCLWSGIVRVMQRTGLTEILAKIISPVLKIMLPYTYKLKKQGSKDAVCALQSVSANISANILGLGNAATPLGVDAIKKLGVLKNKSKTADPDAANSDMIMFVVFNCASFQIIPTTLIALRSAAGSSNAFEVIPAVWLCSLATAVFAVLTVKLFGFIGGEKF
ncbi:MAG: spore maturation protein A [Oscillospiraceae bacterium]|nr:spore maturation protein A [Oscillospiraceae bacterium]